eukprot:982746-Prorocentrum_minimum.AAC.2
MRINPYFLCLIGPCAEASAKSDSARVVQVAHFRPRFSSVDKSVQDFAFRVCFKRGIGGKSCLSISSRKRRSYHTFNARATPTL